MKTLVTQRRRDELAAMLIQYGHIDASAQAAVYGVSRETIRKDLLYLERIGLARKGYGGAVIASGITEQSFLEKSVENQSEKQRIAAAGRALIEPGDIILLDSGSTVCALARLLAMQPMEITIFTNSLKSAQVLMDAGIACYMLGGQVRTSSGAVTGPFAVQQLSVLHAHKAFLGASGWTGYGPGIESFEEAQIKQAMIAAADQSYLLCDSSKAGRTAMLQFCQWQSLNRLITDNKLDRARCDALSNHLPVDRV